MLDLRNLDGRAWSWPDLKPLGGNKVTFPGTSAEPSLELSLHPHAGLRSWQELSGLKIKHADDKTVDELFRQKLKESGFSDEKIATIHRSQGRQWTVPSRVVHVRGLVEVEAARPPARNFGSSEMAALAG